MVEANLPLEQVLDLVGIFAFALSGALLAVRKQFDIVGMIVLAGATALGGGIIRDLLIGAVPPVAFTNTTWLMLPAVAAVLTFFFHPHLQRLHVAVQVCDAAGLGLFCVSGTAKALAYGLGPAPAVVLGVVTGIGGGLRVFGRGSRPDTCPVALLETWLRLGHVGRRPCSGRSRARAATRRRG